ncbi:MAG TPA: KH domain-containing protein [Chloroflexota bacterium]|nr:KH domain-containing protein [Chloroflexota bacterium]
MDRFGDARARRFGSPGGARVSTKDFVEKMISVLVEHPEDVEVATVEGDRSILVEARVPSAEAGRVIGRDGRVINALRTLVGALAARDGKRAVLDVSERSMEGREPEPRT